MSFPKQRYLWPHAVAVLVALAGVLPAWGADDQIQIVPGQSLGPVSLGMSLGEVTAILGRPIQGQNGSLVFPHWKITVMLDEGLVARISTTDPLYRTRRGAGIGTGPEVVMQLVGDLNEFYTVEGNDTTALYPFLGVGFVFRDGRAVEVFVVKPLALRPPPLAAQPVTPPSTDIGASTPGPGTVPSPGTAPGMTPPPGPFPDVTLQGLPSPGALVQVRGLGESVDVIRARLEVSGRIANVTSQPVGPAIVTGKFVAGNGQVTQAQTMIQQPIPAGADAPFTLEASVDLSVVVRYTVEVTLGGLGATPAPVQEPRTVPVAEYSDFARQRVQVSVQLGAPSNTAPMVQVLVSITGTGPIPQQWVRQVQVEIPYTGGARSLTLAPGDVQTVLIPSVAQVQPPQIKGVTLSAP